MKKLKNPFAGISRWATAHHKSLSSFATNFIATVLGIALTFGTTMLLDKKHKKEAAESLVERCLSNMEERLRSLDNVVAFYDRHDQLYHTATSSPLDSLSDELLGSLIYEYTTQYGQVINHAFEKSFSQSVTSHEILGQYASVIGEGFEYLLYAENMHEQINLLQADLLKSEIMQCNTYWDKNSMKDVVAYALSDPSFAYTQEMFVHYSSSVRHIHHLLTLYIPEARNLWEGKITENEFRDKISKRWYEW